MLGFPKKSERNLFAQACNVAPPLFLEGTFAVCVSIQNYTRSEKVHLNGICNFDKSLTRNQMKHKNRKKSCSIVQYEKNDPSILCREEKEQIAPKAVVLSGIERIFEATLLDRSRLRCI